MFNHLKALNNESIAACELIPIATIKRKDDSLLWFIRPDQYNNFLLGRDTSDIILIWYSEEEYLAKPKYEYGAEFICSLET